MDKRSRGFLGWLTARLPFDREVDGEAILEACQHTGLAPERALQILVEQPEQFNRAMQKRASRIAGVWAPKSHAHQVATGLRTNLIYHPRRLKKLLPNGVPV